MPASPSVRLTDAVEHVRETLGLSAIDASVYVRLCMSGALKVSDLAEALHLHRNDVYRSVERLGARALVETTLEKPARYVAANPELIFDTELSVLTAAVDAMKADRERTMQAVMAFQGQALARRKPEYSVLQGRQEISAQRRRMIADAKHDIVHVSTAPNAHVLAEFDGTLDALLSHKSDGVEARLLLHVTPETLAAAPLVAEFERLRVRHVDLGIDLSFTITDGDELLMLVVHDHSRALHAPDEVAILTTASGVVDAEQIFFEQCWKNAQRVPPPARAGVAPVRTPV